MPAAVDFQTLPQLFFRLEERDSGRNLPVMRFKETKTREWVDIGWVEFGLRLRSLAAYLHGQGVRIGDRVAILSENRPEWTITDAALQQLGAINVSLYTSLPASQVSYILKDSGARVLVVSTGLQRKKAEKVFDECPSLECVITMEELSPGLPDWMTHWDDVLRSGEVLLQSTRETIEKASQSVKPSDVAALIYTSGTTGTPKGAMITHENFCSNAVASLTLVQFGVDDHHLSFLPLCHVFERTAGYIAVLAAGGRISYAESVNTVNRNLSELRPTVLISVPRLFERIYNLVQKSIDEGSPIQRRVFDWAMDVGRRYRLDAKRDLITKGQQAVAHKLVFKKLHDRLGGRLRFAVSGGAALPTAIGEFFLSAGITIIEGYGLTETSPVLTINPFDSPRFGSVGRVIGGVTIGIQSVSNGSILAQISGDDYPTDQSSDEGEIIAKGPNIMKGYWNDEEATREVIDSDGWFHTGDVGRFENGRLRITDRIKHMIISKGGKNIYPGPIEDLFKTVRWINQLVVIGEGREFLSALVVPEKDAIEHFAKSQGIPFQSFDQLYAREEIQRLFAEEFKSYSRGAASHERIRDFRLITEPFSVEAGTMTPTLKLKRAVVEKRFADVIEEMYLNVV